MRTQIRRGAFETNSSSTHAINIYCGTNYNIPERVIVCPGEFGWDCDKFYDFESKLSYLYTWILYKCNPYKLNEVTNKYELTCDYKLLKDYQCRIKSKLEELGVNEIEFEKNNTWFENGYIDHCGDLSDEDLEKILNDYFEDFIFNDASYIETGNDNDDYDVDTDPDADFSIYKGN